MPFKGMPNLMRLMKSTQTGRSFSPNSSTVPVRELHLRPHALHLKRWRPDALAPGLPYPGIRSWGTADAGDTGPPPHRTSRIRSDRGIRAPKRRRQAPRNRRAKATRRARDTGSLASWMIIPSAQAPTRQDHRQTKNQVGVRAHSLLAETIIAASGRHHRRSVLESARLLNC